MLNGNGANVFESSDAKDVVLRLVFSPVNGLDMGLSGLTGKFDTDTLYGLDRQKWAVHAEYDRQALFVRSELMGLHTDTGNVTVQSLGGYLLGGYRITDQWNIIGRADYHQPDDRVSDAYQGLTVGSNYFITDRTRLSLNATTFTEAGNDEDRFYELNIQLQFVL